MISHAGKAISVAAAGAVAADAISTATSRSSSDGAAVREVSFHFHQVSLLGSIPRVAAKSAALSISGGSR